MLSKKSPLKLKSHQPVTIPTVSYIKITSFRPKIDQFWEEMSFFLQRIHFIFVVIVILIHFLIWKFIKIFLKQVLLKFRF